jgi:CRISPR system Cascade subunit CasA
MTETGQTPTFNLWTEPWISLERSDGRLERVSLEQALLGAHSYAAIYDASPLVVVGLHRLLVAILHSALDPRTRSALLALVADQRFPAQAIADFGARYAHRFDLFSERLPFLQSADLPLLPAKGEDTKSVSQLTLETSRTSALEHYRHGRAKDEVFCAPCAAAGLATMPPFTSTGGRGMKPSINGVPPIYVIPGGATLFQSLVASLLLPNKWPKAATPEEDAPWWVRDGLVGKDTPLREVGYLQSLTWPARRVRLRPELMDTTCTRCGQTTCWGVRDILYEMGELRPKDAAPWLDPFAAYTIPEKADAPRPVRPRQGRAAWREFAALFLRLPEGGGPATIRPAVLDQIAELKLGAGRNTYPFRCVGVRTDMKAKCFEWMDASFDVPPELLEDAQAALFVRQGLTLATQCEQVIGQVFAVVFSRTIKQERYTRLRQRMQDSYWTMLAEPFRQFVLAIAAADTREPVFSGWIDTAIRQARQCFTEAAETSGAGADALMLQANGERRCQIRLAKLKKEYAADE